MKKRNTAIAAVLALLPLGNPLVIGTGIALTSTAVVISIPKANAGNASSYLKKGDKKIDNENYKGAILDLNKAIKKDSEYLEAYLSRAHAKFMIEDYKGSIKDATKAIEIDPEYSSAYTTRGNSKEYLDNLNGACSDWRKASQLGDENAKGYVKDQC